VDAALVMRRDGKQTVLEIVSRDTPEVQFTLVRNMVSGAWLVHETPEVIGSRGKQAVLDLIVDKGPLTSGNATVLLPDYNPSSIRTWIDRLEQSGKIIQAQDGKYSARAEIFRVA
jgi:hypothetical protein